MRLSAPAIPGRASRACFGRTWRRAQPHCWSSSRKVFSAADTVLVVDQFASAREHEEGVGSKELADAIGRHHVATTYVGSLQSAVDHLASHTQAREIVVTMGVGDVYKVKDLMSK